MPGMSDCMSRVPRTPGSASRNAPRTPTRVAAVVLAAMALGGCMSVSEPDRAHPAGGEGRNGQPDGVPSGPGRGSVLPDGVRQADARPQRGGAHEASRKPERRDEEERTESRAPGGGKGKTRPGAVERPSDTPPPAAEPPPGSEAPEPSPSVTAPRPRPTPPRPSSPPPEPSTPVPTTEPTTAPPPTTPEPTGGPDPAPRARPLRDR